MYVTCIISTSMLCCSIRIVMPIGMLIMITSIKLIMIIMIVIVIVIVATTPGLPAGRRACPSSKVV